MTGLGNSSRWLRRSRSAAQWCGDLHFSQGDGEINFCGAIEMGGYIDFHIDLIKGGMETYGIRNNPVFMPPAGGAAVLRVPDLHRHLR